MTGNYYIALGLVVQNLTNGLVLHSKGVTKKLSKPAETTE